MSTNIVGLIAEKQSSEAVFAVKKALAKKLVQSISEAKTEVARKTYGRIVEFYGADEQPDYMNDSDNAYAMFFANALKKFGVSGPEDFQDDVTKQRFFDYVDQNWRAQDTVQTPIANASTQANMERGTQTQLPSAATPPMAPTAPSQGPAPTTAQGNDPSVATMSPAGPSIDKTAPLNQAGQDPTLNNVQNSQAFGGQIGGQGQGDQYGNMGNPQGMSHNDACPYCKGSGKAACPTCGRPHGIEQQQQGMGGMDGMTDQDPDLEIGPEGSEDGGEQPLAGDDETGMSDDQLGGDEDGMMGGDEEQGGQAPIPGQEEDVDDPFDDEDAYSIDASDFDQSGGQAGGEEGGMGGGMNGDEGSGFGDQDGDEEGSEGSDQFGGDNGEGDEDLDDDSFEDEDDDQGGFGGDANGAVAPGNGNDDEDPDLEIGDEDTDDGSDDSDDESGFGGDDDQDEDDDADEDDEADDDGGDEKQKNFPPVEEALKHRSYSRKERKADGKRNQREDAKKQVRMAEDFGFGLDDAEDAVFMTEASMQAGVDPVLNKIITYVQDQLNRIKKMRNTMLMQLRRQRAVIKKDPALGPDDKMDAMKQLATMAKDNRKFFKSQAKLVKAIFTGHLGGDGGDMDQDMGQEPDDQQSMQDGGQQFPPKGGKGGFPPQGGNEDGGDMDQDQDMNVDPDGDGDNDMDPDQDTDQDFAGGDDSGDDESNFGSGDDEGDGESYEEDSDDGSGDDGNPDNDPENITNDDDGDDFDNFKKPAKKKGNFPPKGGVKEDVSALESKIKMLHMQIATQGDSTGKRKQALRSLEEQLKK